jgi:hypothetical protein
MELEGWEELRTQYHHIYQLFCVFNFFATTVKIKGMVVRAWIESKLAPTAQGSAIVSSFLLFRFPTFSKYDLSAGSNCSICGNSFWF